MCKFNQKTLRYFKSLSYQERINRNSVSSKIYKIAVYCDFNKGHNGKTNKANKSEEV